ncbi:MAG: flagellar hook-length control protein FliK, partial [Lachnospiraceae bacterium]
GIKVEAIEVTIGTHEFEQNLEGNQQNSSEEQKEEAGKNPRRSINLNNLDELSGVMSEEESLAAKIMSQHGNRVDLTA